jgi:hypothetical protein
MMAITTSSSTRVKPRFQLRVDIDTSWKRKKEKNECDERRRLPAPRSVPRINRSKKMALRNQPKRRWPIETPVTLSIG